MSEPVVAREVAEAEVAAWEESFGVTLEQDYRDAITRAVMAGRLSLGEDEEFTYRLRRPLVLENGTKIMELKIHQPTGGQYRDATKGNREQLEQSMRILGFITGCPVIDRIGIKDLNAMGAVLGFFS